MTEIASLTGASNYFEDFEVGMAIRHARGKTVTPLENAADDYLESLELLWPFADYVVINVSSPHTVGLRRLQEHALLAGLLGKVISA